MLNLQNLTLIRGDKTLLEDVSLTIHAKQKVGLIGPNGCGKSSLLSLILGEFQPNLGDISYQKQCRIAHVAQETPALDCPALDYVLQGDENLWQVLSALKQAEEQSDYTQVAHLHLQMDELQGYTAEHRAKELLHHLGFDHQQQKRTVASFSGGWRMRLNLARALFTPSDLLLLDEPTNHLDLEAIIWLEKWLADTTTTLIIISHDRDFLDKVITHVAHIDHGAIKLYSGNYSSFEAQRAQALALQQAQYEKQQRKVKHLMRFVDRFRYKASKAKQAQSRLKMIDKMATVAAVQAESPFTFEFFEPDDCSNPMVTMKNVTCAYGDTVIIKDINLQIIKGDRIGLLGVNGSGKSTFIKALTKQLPVEGDIQFTPKINIGYFAQHQLDYLEPDLTPLQHMQQIAKAKGEQELRNYLGGFAFSGDMALTPIENLSGGERARLALAMLIWKKPSLLLLDEPTNHLDIDMRMALSMALQNYSGALVLVSHDRYLLEALTDQLWLIKDKRLNNFDGSMHDYKKLLLSSDQPTKTKKNSKPVSEKNKEKKVDLKSLEKKLALLTDELQQVEVQLGDTELYQADKQQQLLSLQQQQENLQQKISKLEDDWIKAHE